MKNAELKVSLQTPNPTFRSFFMCQGHTMLQFLGQLAMIMPRLLSQIALYLLAPSTNGIRWCFKNGAQETRRFSRFCVRTVRGCVNYDGVIQETVCRDIEAVIRRRIAVAYLCSL